MPITVPKHMSDKLQIPTNARLRYDEITADGKKTFLRRYKRLRKEGYPADRAALLCAGYLPDDIRKWPPTMRYRLSDAVRKHGKMVGTADWQDLMEQETARARRWFEGWFYRNHEKEEHAAK